MESKIRIARFLALCGLSSRRKCEDIIFAGRVKVNGITVKDPAVKIYAKKDKIEVDGNVMAFQEEIVLALNKPAGYVSTVSDDLKRKTVLDLVKDLKKDLQYRLYPVGRLDADSRGLIILTNNGELANRVMHPRYGLSKVYEVAIEGKIQKKDIGLIKKGIEIEGRELLPLKIEQAGFINKKNSLIRIKIAEGRKRIIRKTFLKLGYNVIDLKRVQIGNLKLGDLKEGSYKILNGPEIESLLRP